MSIKALASCLPKVLQIGPFPYKVSFAEGWVQIEEAQKWGVCDHAKACITISNPSVLPSKEMFVGVVMHEVLHALWATGNLPTKAKEEDAVMALEVGLLQLFKDNPLLIDWIKKGLK